MSLCVILQLVQKLQLSIFRARSDLYLGAYHVAVLLSYTLLVWKGIRHYRKRIRFTLEGYKGYTIS